MHATEHILIENFIHGDGMSSILAQTENNDSTSTGNQSITDRNKRLASLTLDAILKMVRIKIISLFLVFSYNENVLVLINVGV